MYYIDIEYDFFDHRYEKVETFASAVSKLWMYPHPEAPSGWAAIIDENDNVLEEFKYNRDKKGYRPIKPMEWR